MIEIKAPFGFVFEPGTSFPAYLPDSSVEEVGNRYVMVKGDYLGSRFINGQVYRFLKKVIRIVPELPLNQVIGIPSLEGKIFEED